MGWDTIGSLNYWIVFSRDTNYFRIILNAALRTDSGEGGIKGKKIVRSVKRPLK